MGAFAASSPQSSEGILSHITCDGGWHGDRVAPVRAEVFRGLVIMLTQGFSRSEKGVQMGVRMSWQAFLVVTKKGAC